MGAALERVKCDKNNNNSNNNSSVIRGRYGVKEKGNEKKEKQIDHKTEGKKKREEKRKNEKGKGGGEIIKMKIKEATKRRRMRFTCKS